MAAEPAPLRSRDIRAVSRDVAGADNARVLRVVATVDAMSARGSADELIAPLRQRLAVLRPPRPLRFPRLMFHPLDPLIVPAGRWRPDRPTIPRTALTPLAECVRAAMGREAGAIESAINGRTTAATDLIAAQGRLLWPLAGRLLISAAAPASWSETGFAAGIFAPLARRTGVLLSQMGAFDRLCTETARGLLPPRADSLHAILREIAAADESALPMMVTLLLHRLPEAAALLVAGQPGSHGAALKTTADQTVDRMLEQLARKEGAAAELAATSLEEAGAATRRIATLLRQLEEGTVTPARRAQLKLVRQQLDAGCRVRFAAGLRDEVLAPLLAGGSPDVRVLEIAARDLRALETEARVVGGGSAYDLMLRQAADAVQALPAEGGPGRTDRIRLVEILAGSEAALAMLDER
nr:hypothetical protein [uncultured Rhodopila sp.]